MTSRFVFKVLIEDGDKALGVDEVLKKLVAPEATDLVKIVTPYVWGASFFF